MTTAKQINDRSFFFFCIVSMVKLEQEIWANAHETCKKAYSSFGSVV